MQAWVVDTPGPIDAGPLRRVEPRAARARRRARSGCGSPAAASAGPTCTWPRATCRRAGRRSTPGHEVVGRGRGRRPGCARGSRSASASASPWLGRTDGTLPVLPAGRREPVHRARRSPAGTSTAGTPTRAWSTSGSPTGCPTALDDEQAAPLLCAGIIGYRALRCAAVPAGGRLGIYGFGGSAHLTAQVALAQGLRVHVFTRGEHNRRLAAELGADSVGDAADPRPEPLDGAILFAPAGDLVPVALRALDRGGDPGRRRHLAVRHPGARLRGRAVPGAAAAQRHRQHPAGRRGVPPAGRAPRRAGHDGGLPDGGGRRRPGRPRARPLRRRRRPAELGTARDRQQCARACAVLRAELHIRAHRRLAVAA